MLRATARVTFVFRIVASGIQRNDTKRRKFHITRCITLKTHLYSGATHPQVFVSSFVSICETNKSYIKMINCVCYLEPVQDYSLLQ